MFTSVTKLNSRAPTQEPTPRFRGKSLMNSGLPLVGAPRIERSLVMCVRACGRAEQNNPQVKVTGWLSRPADDIVLR